MRREAMKLFEEIISKGIYLLVFGMFLYLALTTLAIGHVPGIFDCQTCNNAMMASLIH